MSYGYFSKHDRAVLRVFQIREHHAKIVKLGRYEIHTEKRSCFKHMVNMLLEQALERFSITFLLIFAFEKRNESRR